MNIHLSDGDKWTADIVLSPEWWRKADLIHLVARVEGKTEEDALAGAQSVLDLFAKGRDAWIRTRPEAVSDLNFDTQEVRHRGFVRFSFKLKAGDWFDVKAEVTRLPMMAL
jgi:hypothetical protein